MRYKTAFLLVTAVCAGMFLCLNFQILSAQQQKQHENKTQRLVRIDLLKTKDQSIKPPLRNIFTAKKREPSLDLEKRKATGMEGLEPGLGIQANQKEAQESERDLEKIIIPGLKYLGFVASPEKKVALVLYKGQTLAVEKGFILPGGIEVTDISLNTLTIQSSGSDKKVVKLEGEEK